MADLTKDEMRDRIVELRELREKLDAEYEGKRFDEDAKNRFNSYSEEIEEIENTLEELSRREAVIASAAEDGKTEEGVKFHTNRQGVARGDDIWDLATLNRSYDDPNVEGRELRDRALRAVEEAHFPHPNSNREELQGFLDNEIRSEGAHGTGIARHIMLTGSPTYRRAFTKKFQGAPMSESETTALYRAMSLTLASGGAAVPYVLDPTVIPISAGAVNPYRAIASVTQVSVDEWRGVTSAGITAAFQAEAAATTDQSPTLAQPTVSTEMGRVNIPYSIEIGMDWGDFAGSMAVDIQDSKDVLEATKFAVGSGTNEPFGVVTGSSNSVYTASNTNSLVIADLYGWHDALSPRFRTNASITLNNAVLSKIRQLDTAGGSQMLTSNLQERSAALPGSFTEGRANVNIFGKPVYEASGQSGTFTTGQLIGVIGDFRHFKIIDRVGLTIVDAGYLQDATTGFPTGQKAMLAYWRTGSKVLNNTSFKVLKLA